MLVRPNVVAPGPPQSLCAGVLRGSPEQMKSDQHSGYLVVLCRNTVPSEKTPRRSHSIFFSNLERCYGIRFFPKI